MIVASHCARRFVETESLRKAIVALLWLIVASSGWFWLGPTWLSAMRPAPGRITDFYQDWGSARNHLVGLPVYTHHVVSIPWHLGIPADQTNTIEYNAHPPPAVLLVLPLAYLSYPDAVLVWNVISLVSLALSLSILAMQLDLSCTILPPTLALLAVCHPIYGNLYLGQFTLVLLLLLTLIWALERSGRSTTAGLIVGTAAAIKLFPAYLVVFYLARARIQSVGAAALSFLAMTVAAALVLGLDCYQDYIGVVIPGQARFWSCAYNLSMTGFWHKLFNPAMELKSVSPLWWSPALACRATLTSDVIITAIVAKCAYRARTLFQCELALALTVTAMLLVSPVTWDFSLPLLLVPIAVIARWQCTANSRRMLALTALILIIIWIPQNLLTALAQAGHVPTTYSWQFMLGAPSLKFYALLAILMLGLATFQAEKQQKPIATRLQSPACN